MPEQLHNHQPLTQSCVTAHPDTEYVGKDGKPSLAVLSLGCGTSSKLSVIGKYGGQAQWITGPIIDILQGGAGELSAALNQQIGGEWPVRHSTAAALFPTLQANVRC